MGPETLKRVLGRSRASSQASGPGTCWSCPRTYSAVAPTFSWKWQEKRLQARGAGWGVRWGYGPDTFLNKPAFRGAAGMLSPSLGGSGWGAQADPRAP